MQEREIARQKNEKVWRPVQITGAWLRGSGPGARLCCVTAQRHTTCPPTSQIVSYSWVLDIVTLGFEEARQGRNYVQLTKVCREGVVNFLLRLWECNATPGRPLRRSDF